MPEDKMDYCSDRCYEAAQAGKGSYAPCPLITPVTGDNTCPHCGWLARKQPAEVK